MHDKSEYDNLFLSYLLALYLHPLLHNYALYILVLLTLLTICMN